MNELMASRDFWLWYFVAGLLTCVIAMYRNSRNKYLAPPNEMMMISYFLLPWIWLPVFVTRWLYYKIIYNENI